MNGQVPEAIAVHRSAQPATMLVAVKDILLQAAVLYLVVPTLHIVPAVACNKTSLFPLFRRFSSTVTLRSGTEFLGVSAASTPTILSLLLQTTFSATALAVQLGTTHVNKFAATTARFHGHAQHSIREEATT